MEAFGMVKPGSVLYVYFDTFAAATGAPITMTNFAVGDIKIYKNGSTTERSSTSGFTLLDTDGVDFDGITGIQGFSVDLADNSDAGFYVAGARYRIVVSTVTIDSQTVSFIAGSFQIGYSDAIINTTIATLASQTSFTLTAGPAEDDALNGCEIVFHDIASAVQIGRAVVLDYTGSTKTVTLVAAPTFTIAAGDNVAVFLRPTTLTVGEIADAVWDEARSGHTTSGTFGEGVKAESLNSQAQSDVEAIVDGIIQSYFDPSSNGNYADLKHLVSAATIATLTSQTLFTLSFGSPDNDAYNGALIVVSDAVTAAQRCFGYISDYVGSTKAVTLRADPGIFTMAVGDRVDIYAKPTVDVESMVDNVITAAKIASDAITAAKIAADAIGASEIAAGALDADAFTTALAQKIADVILRRQMDNVEASSNGDTLDKSSLYGLVQQAQESNTVDNAGELTIYKTDGTTELGRLTLDTDAAAEPVTGVS